MIGWALVAVAAAEPWGLRDAVRYALAHNLEVRGEALDAESAAVALVAARAARGPSLSASASASGYADAAGPDAADDGAAWRLGLSQPLPTGGTLWVGGAQDQSFARRLGPEASVYSFAGATLDQPLLDGAWGAARLDMARAGFAAEAAALGERDARERLVVEVANAYWGLVAARESLRLAERSVEIAEKQLADTRERYDEGFAGSGDLLQLERALGVARQTAVVAEATAAAAARTLARRMGLPVAGAAAIVCTDRPEAAGEAPALDAALAEARVGNAALARARLAVAAARRERAAARVAALPDLDLSAALGASADADPAGALAALTGAPDAAWSVGLTLGVPLAWEGARAELREGELVVRRAELAAEAVEETIAGEVAAAVDGVRRDRARVALAEATLAAAEQGLAADQELYREGRGGTREVVRSLELLEAAQVARLAAEIDLQASLLALARLRGRVIEETAGT